jgi:hypothetical protein
MYRRTLLFVISKSDNVDSGSANHDGHRCIHKHHDDCRANSRAGYDYRRNNDAADNGDCYYHACGCVYVPGWRK